MSVDFLELLEQEVERAQAEIPDEGTLANISTLAERQLKLEALLEKLENVQKRIVDAHREVSERYLPNALASAGVTEFKLTDGSVISVKKNYFPSVEDANKAEAYQWMVSNGHDIIKNEVVLTLPKGKSDEAKEVVSILEELGYKPTQKESIHWQTFRAWAKEVMEKGMEVPETIKIHIVDKTSIKRPK